MQIASLNLESNMYRLNFVPKTKDKVLYELQKNDTSIFAYFEIFGSNKYYALISYPLKSLQSDIDLIKKEIYTQLFQILLLTFFISVLFSLYALQPLKQSLRMTNEFIKDILHDFNTPISTIRLNIDLLQEQSTKPLLRIKSGINTILNLQNNLKNYIDDEVGEKEEFELSELIKERISSVQGSFPNIHLYNKVPPLKLHCYKDGLIRILDNLLSNSCKYNVNDGEVFITLQESTLIIKDTGIGIKQPHKVFERFYKETSRGLGIGLHIVQKLSSAMQINIKVESKLNKGTTIYLDLSSLTLL